jgi:succinoglycan biosynthesis transport protein ExoP
MIHRQSNELHFRQVTVLLRRRWPLIATAVLIGGGLVGALAVLLPPRYTAKAQLLYEAHVRSGVEVVDDAAVETLVEMLVSPSHLQSLAASLAGEAGSKPEPQVAAHPDSPQGHTETTAALSDPAGAAATSIPDYDELEKSLNSYKERKSRLIAVTFTSTDPEMAARVANRAVQLYLNAEVARRKEAHDEALQSVTEDLVTARADLDRAEGAVRDYRIAYGMRETGRASLLDQEIADLNRQLDITKSELAAQDERLKGLRTSGDDRSSSSGAFRARGDKADRMATASAASADNASVSVTGASSTRDGEIRVPEGLGTADSGMAQAQLVLDRDATEARLHDIEQRLATLRKAGAEVGTQEIRLGELEYEAAAAGQTYQKLLSQQADLLDQGDIRLPVRVVTVADVPDQPSSPNPLLFLLPAIVASGIMGGLLAILLERLDQRLRSQRDVEDALGIPCIGLIPKLAEAARPESLPHVLRDKPFAPFTEAIRSVVISATQPRGPDDRTRTFLLTSSAEREGKTVLALAFAVYAAQLHRRVLLIDFDFRHPGIAQALGNSAAPDGAEQPDDPAPRPPVRRATDFGIDYLQLAQPRVDPMAMLSRDEFREMILRELPGMYDCIVIDSAPLSRAAETRVLARMVDRVILAVKWGATDVRSVRMALQQLHILGGGSEASLAAVVTQVKMRTHLRRRYDEPGPYLEAMRPQTGGDRPA